MSRCPIIFGEINKKLLLPAFLTITQIILLIVSTFYQKGKKDIISSLYSLSLGQIIIKFLPFILKISIDIDKKEKELNQRKFLHYFILCLIFLLNQGIHLGIVIAGEYLLVEEKTYTDSNLFFVQDFAILSIEMAFIAVFSRFLLKNKYFEHHIISIIIFIVLGIASEVIIFITTKKINEISSGYKYYFIINSIKIINTLVDAFYLCYQKYMIDGFYYPFWNIPFISGIFFFAVVTVLLIIILVCPNSDLSFIKNFYLYYQFSNGWTIFGKIIIVLVLHIILCPLNILVIFYYNPNFILIIFQMSTIVYSLIQYPRESLYCIPLYVIQFLSLMIHLEILELNFCGLNKNAKRNIDLRGLIDYSLTERQTGLEKPDINADYCIQIDSGTIIEMEEKTENLIEI